LQNMIVMSEGSVKKRYGLKHISKYANIAYDANNPEQSHLASFEFSDDEQYVISIEHQSLRAFWLNPDGDVTLVSTITLDTNSDPLPFDQQYLLQYTTAQYGDVMFICHPLFMPRMLIRTGLFSFEITPYTFDERYDGEATYQPYTSFQPHNTTLDPSATSGTGITLTTNEPYFTAEHIGVRLRYDLSEILITSVTSDTVATGDVIKTLENRLTILNPFRSKSGSATIEVTQFNHGFAGGETITVSGAVPFAGITSANLNKTTTVTGVIDENVWTYTAATANSSEDGGGYVTISSHAPTYNWSEQAFSAVRGYPAAVVFHENRLCFGGTIAQPDAIWMSQIGSFFNFNVGSGNDNEAINIIAATGKINEVRYMVSNRDLQIFGAAGELYVPTYLNQAITPTNAQIRLQTPFGTEFVHPMSIDGATIFVQNAGGVVREFLYTDTEDAYTATAVSTIASHLILQPTYMAVAHGGFGTPESYAFLTNAAGDIALFNSNRIEKRASWSRLTTNGTFACVCAVHQRAFANVWAPDGSLHLCEFDGGIGLDRYLIQTADGSGAITVSSAFSDGETVAVLNEDGSEYIGSFVVALGAITVPSGAGITYAVGYPFEIDVVTNPIDVSGGNGPATGEPRGIATAVLDLKQTGSVKVNGYSKSITGSISGKHEFRLLGYGRDPQITVSQNEPLPLQLNGIIAELIV
jgi:hypothetical protein